MSKYKIIIVLFFTLIIISNINAQSEKTDFTSVEEKLWELRSDSLFDQGLALLDSIKGKFPDNDFEISSWQTQMYFGLKDYEKAFDVLAAGHQKGYHYFLHLRSRAYSDIAEDERFIKLSKKDEELREAANEKSKTIKKVVLPQNYDKSKSYPLLIILHGGGGTLERCMNRWTSKKMNEDFIIMYVQSYLHYNFSRFSWRSGDERTHNEIKIHFDETISEYNIDTSNIIIGGFSAGGVMAIDLVVSNIFPVKGFFGGCPAEPRSLDLDAAKKMKELNQKGFIIAGETDYFRERQEKMMKLFDEAEFSYEFHEIKGIGHSVPDDFSNWIDIGLNYLLN